MLYGCRKKSLKGIDDYFSGNYYESSIQASGNYGFDLDKSGNIIAVSGGVIDGFDFNSNTFTTESSWWKNTLSSINDISGALGTTLKTITNATDGVINSDTARAIQQATQAEAQRTGNAELQAWANTWGAVVSQMQSKMKTIMLIGGVALGSFILYKLFSKKSATVNA